MRRKNSRSSYFVWLIISIVFVLLVAIGYSTSVYKEYLRTEKIDALTVEIQELRDRRDELTKILDYVKTEQYKEKKAKELLNKKRRGEVVYVIPTGDLLPEDDFEISVGMKPVWRQWVIWFVGK